MPRPAAKKDVTKATKAAKAATKGVKSSSRKVRTSVHFHRPKTLRLARKPMYARKSVPSLPRLDQYTVLKHPLTTEAAMKKIEENNTLVFLCDSRSNKNQIKRSVEQMHNVKVQSINTLIRPDGKKKAFVHLSSDYEAMDVANKIGII